MRMQKMLEQHESDAFGDLATHVQSEDTSTPSSPSKCRAGGQLLLITSTFSEKLPSVVGDALHTSGCNSSIVEDSTCPGHVVDGDKSFKSHIPQPRFNSDAPFALSGVTFGTTDQVALERRIERVRDASFYLERFTFNFSNLTDAFDPSLASVSNDVTACEIWTAGIGSQFVSALDLIGDTGLVDEDFSTDLF